MGWSHWHSFHILRIFLQKSRTKNYYFDYISKCIEYEKLPPFQWKSNNLNARNLQNEPLWWLQNSTGKFIFCNELKPNFQLNILISHKTKILYDLTRIAAELHLKYSNKTPVKEIFNSLESLQATDPYSGKPYKWNKEKNILYSVGPNRIDDLGVYDRQKYFKEEPPDIGIVCIFHRDSNSWVRN